MKQIATSIKKHSLRIKITGGILFVLTIIIGIFWIIMSDNDKFEPLIFVISGISTMVFALPYIADLILPEKKLVRDMSSDEIVEYILTTSKEDWQGNQTFELDEYFLKEDPRLRIVTHDPNDIHNLNFIEPWTNLFFDSSAWSCYYKLLYDGHLIKRAILVHVDGNSNRVLLPLPNLQNMKVKKFDYKIAQIFNAQNILNNYVNRAGFAIE